VRFERSGAQEVRAAAKLHLQDYRAAYDLAVGEFRRQNPEPHRIDNASDNPSYLGGGYKRRPLKYAEQN